MIHTVGPIWRGGSHNEECLLAACYRNSLEIAKEYGIRSVAFPSISTGAYAFPLEKAAKVAVYTVDEYLRANKGIFDRVIWVLFDKHTNDIYAAEIDNLKAMRCEGKINELNN